MRRLILAAALALAVPLAAQAQSVRPTPVAAPGDQQQFVGTWDFFTIASGDPSRGERLVERLLEVKLTSSGGLECRLDYTWNRKAYFRPCTVHGGELHFTGETSNGKHVKARFSPTTGNGVMTYPDGDFAMKKVTRKSA